MTLEETDSYQVTDCGQYIHIIFLKYTLKRCALHSERNPGVYIVALRVIDIAGPISGICV